MSGLRGGLSLLAGVNDAGATILRRQSFAPPIHISKPHHDSGWLVVNMASPSPGLLAGDRVEVNVIVESGARLLLTAPSASRIHTMPGGHAEVVQSFTVASAGFLDVWPEYLIPQTGSAYRQRTSLRVEEGGNLIWTESIAPGRTARGEWFAFREVSLSTDLFLGDVQIVRERYSLNPSNLGSLRSRFPTAYYAGILCVGPALAEDAATLRALTEDFPAESVWIGATRLAPTAWAIKIIAADSPLLRSTVAAVRRALFTALRCTLGNLRRTG